MNLFCFPYAGASSCFYNAWSNMGDKKLTIIPIELPGHILRIKEPLCDSMDLIIEDIYGQIGNRLMEAPYLFYGHSMGALIVYYLTRYLWMKGDTLPRHIFVSGKEAPHINHPENMISAELDSKFIAEVSLLGGIPDEIRNNANLMEFFLPILRNDYRLIEECEFRDIPNPFPCGITVFHGDEDTISKEDAMEWKKYTSSPFEFFTFSGNHFFINYHKDEMLRIMGGYAKQ